jgi:hypothetical protein
VAKQKTISSTTGGRFLRPHSVGSSIHWYVHVYEFTESYGEFNEGKKRPRRQNAGIHARIRLTDCEDNIDWSLNEQKDLEKLDNAIAELKAARAVFAAALAKQKQYRAKVGIPIIEDEDEFDL